MNIDAFFSDPDLVRLIEQVKCSDDIFDVIDLSETQQSNMLAWCLNPNEGHGQGDAIIKDFLVAAHSKCETSKFDNKRFFSTWTPGRIRMATFGSAFTSREYGILRDEGNRGRLDIFLVDPTNKILVVIENKCRARLDASQLSDYHGAVKQQIAQRPAFKDYDLAFIVLDEGLESYDDEYIESMGNKWVYLDYGWLKNSGERARLQVERGNHAAQLLVAYCQEQTAWESKAEQRLSELAASLAASHEEVVTTLKSCMKIDIKEWTASSLQGSDGELILFSKQHTQLCSHLIRAQGVAGIQVGIKRALPHLKPEHINIGRTWIGFIIPEVEELLKNEAYPTWPIHINIFRESNTSDKSSKFTLRLIWRHDEFNEAVRPQELREHFQTRFPDLKKFGSSSYRRIVLGRQLDVNKAVAEAVITAKTIKELIRRRPS